MFYVCATAGSVVKKMRGKLGTLKRKPHETEEFTIFRIPENVRQSKRHLFEPFAVSIGPYHRGLAHLQALEQKKWRFLQDFLSRGSDTSLDACAIEIKGLERKARKCYNETVNMDSDSFVEMMVLDGCFILEVFKKLIERKSDAIQDSGWVCSFISTDLILMENQIPFFIIQKLWLIVVREEFSSLEMKALVSFLTNDKLSRKIWEPPPPGQIHHLLHLCYRSIVPDESDHKLHVARKFLKLKHYLNPHLHCLDTILKGSHKLLNGFLSLSWLRKGSDKLFGRYIRLSWLFEGTQQSNPKKSKKMIPCATELREAGIKFEPKKLPRHLVDITFRFGTLEIPCIEIDDFIKCLLMNLIAFEQCGSSKLPRLITSYVMLMDSIVNTSNDVGILQRKRIIDNMLSGEEEVAIFFNHLGEGMVIDSEHHLSGLFERVNKYCETKYQRYRAKFMRNYFNNPWSIISLIAAFVLLALSFLQTFFAVYSYFWPNNSS